MEWTSKHQNFKSANDKAVFRSSVNKEQRLACEKKEQRQRRLQERRLQLRREARKRREQSRRRLKKKKQEPQKRLKAQRKRGPAHVSFKQPNKGRRLLDQSDGNARRHENETRTATQPATKVHAQPAISYSETMWVKTSKAWTWNPVYKLLSVDLTWRIFPLLLEESFWQQNETPNHSNTDRMNSSFKVHFMLSVLTLGLIFIEEIEPYQFEIQNWQVPYGHFNLPLVLCFSLARWFPLLNRNIFSNSSRSSNCL